MLPPKTQEPVIRKIIGVFLPGFAANAALDPQARKITPPCFARRAVSTIPFPQALSLYGAGRTQCSWPVVGVPKLASFKIDLLPTPCTAANPPDR